MVTTAGGIAGFKEDDLNTEAYFNQYPINYNQDPSQVGASQQLDAVQNSGAISNSNSSDMLSKLAMMDQVQKIIEKLLAMAHKHPKSVAIWTAIINEKAKLKTLAKETGKDPAASLQSMQLLAAESDSAQSKASSFDTKSFAMAMETTDNQGRERTQITSDALHVASITSKPV